MTKGLKSIIKKSNKKLVVLLAMMLCFSFMMAGCTNDSAGRDENVDEADAGDEDVIVVSSAAEFLDAIEPGAVIEFKKGTYNLTPDLDDLFDGDGKKFNKNHEYVSLEDGYDGVQIIITDVDNLSIRGQEGENIELQVEPRYADVLRFENCTDITLSNMTMGHTKEQGSCEGDVLEFNDCSDISLENLDLYGCGAYGITTNNVSKLTVMDSNIHDCSYGFAFFNESEKLGFKNCTITGIEGFGVIQGYKSNMTFTKCSFDDNDCTYGFISSDANNSISFKACSFGSAESAAVNGGDLGVTYGASFDDKCSYADFVPNQGGASYTYVSDGVIDSEQEILEAIEAGGEVVIEDGYYNLSEYIESVDMDEWNENHSYVFIEEVFDGRGVFVFDLDGLRISSASEDPANCEIVVDPRYSEVFNFAYCSDILMNGITMGHTDLGSCAGDVLEFYACDDIWLYNMDLYGCGVYGLYLDACGTLHMYDSKIHDCESGPANFYNMEGSAFFESCEFVDSGSGFYIGASEYKVYFENCTFGDYETTSVVFNHQAVLDNCVQGDILYYPENYLGSIDDYDVASISVTDFMYQRESADSYWEGIEAINGNDTICLPLYEDDEYYYAYMVLLEDGTGFIEGLYDEDVVSVTWEASKDDSCLVLTEVDQGGFDAFDDEVYVYLYEEKLYGEKIAKLVIDDVDIWFFAAY